MNEPIAQELISLAQYDLRVRERLLKVNRLAPGYNSEMEVVHRENTSRLKEIITLIGWLSQSKVGEEASEAAWLIVQHSIGDSACSYHRIRLTSLWKSSHWIILEICIRMQVLRNGERRWDEYDPLRYR